MMDLIERLRNGCIERERRSGESYIVDSVAADRLMDEAADEIERLQGEVSATEWTCCGMTYTDAYHYRNHRKVCHENRQVDTIDKTFRVADEECERAETTSEPTNTKGGEP